MDILQFCLTLIACVFAFLLGFFIRTSEPSQTYLDNRTWNAAVHFDLRMNRAERLAFLDRIRAMLLSQDDSSQPKKTKNQRPGNQGSQPAEHAHD